MWSWKRKQPADRAARIGALRAKMELAGMPDPDHYATYAIDNDSPELAIFIFLRNIWNNEIDAWQKTAYWLENYVRDLDNRSDESFADGGFALRRLLTAGASREDLAILARSIAGDVAFSIVNLIDNTADFELSDLAEFPRWKLMECDSDGNLTGRHLNGLHEYFL